MTIHLIFLPSLLYNEESGYLKGVSYNFPGSRVKILIVYEKLKDTAENGSSGYSVWEEIDTVGYYYAGNNNLHFVPRKRTWLSICVKFNEFFIKELQSDGTSVLLEDCRLLVYDKNVFLKSELLCKSHSSFTLNEIQADCFKTLMYSLEISSHSNDKDGFLFKLFQPALTTLLLVFKTLLNFSERVYSLLKFSSLGLHFHHFFKNMTWALLSLIDEKKFNLKTGNYFLALLADMIGGTVLLYWLINLFSISEFFSFISDIAQYLVASLQALIGWVMGSPAGLKLNFPLNSILGRFFLYHIDLWWSFLGLVHPFLLFGFQTFLYIGRLGLSFQTAILADILNIASFHAYCIYVYAARLYNLQLMGLGSLSRLFIGCKRNPIPGKVDSCPYTTEQLFVGTISFTVLLFLLPTTFVYYILFTCIRLFVVGVGGVLTRARFLLQSLPLYVLVIWFFKPVLTTSRVQVIPKTAGGSMVLYIRPICSTLWNTVSACIPDPVQRPTPVNWGPLLRNVATGQLIYPV